jgi:hypothetical protein
MWGVRVVRKIDAVIVFGSGSVSSADDYFVGKARFYSQNVFLGAKKEIRVIKNYGGCASQATRHDLQLVRSSRGAYAGCIGRDVVTGVHSNVDGMKQRMEERRKG